MANSPQIAARNRLAILRVLFHAAEPLRVYQLEYRAQMATTSVKNHCSWLGEADLVQHSCIFEGFSVGPARAKRRVFLYSITEKGRAYYIGAAVS